MESESHWGVRTLKGGFFAAVGAIVLMAGLIALFHWSPWKGPTELDWLRSYEAWSESTEAMIADAGSGTRESCESAFDDVVGDPPTERLEPAASAARRGCAALSPDGWQIAESDVVRELRDLHAAEAVAPPRQQPDFSELASSVAGMEVTVFCWREESWTPFLQQFATVRGNDEISLKGLADTAEKRIDLEPGVCTALRGYVRRIQPLHLSYQNFELAEALVVLSHEALRLESPSASEAELECSAVQHVRPFIRAAGWGPSFAEEIALHAWDLGYTQLPAYYRSPECRNGGPLDRHPASSAWP